MIKSILQKVFNQRDLALSASKLVENSDQNAPPKLTPQEGSTQSQEMMDKILQSYVRQDLAHKLGIGRYL